MRTVREVTAGVNEATRQIELNGGSIDRVISTIKTGVGALGVGMGFKELSGQIFQTRAQFEQLEIAFTTMLGSADKANTLLNQLKHTAAKTPFEMEDVVGGAKSLLAYGIEAEKVNDTLIRLGDIASGLSIPLNDLTYLYGTTMVQGKMFTMDFRQFQGRGIPIADELAKVLGIAKDKVGEAVTAGKVGAKELEAAIKGMTDEGGRFGGLMAKQSDSLRGKWENIKDTIGLMFNEMGQQTSGVFNLTLDATAGIVDHWQEVITVLGGVAAAYGAQKAYLMLDTAFTAAKTDFGYNAEIEQLQALIPAKKEAAKTDLEQAVASGQLTEAKAAQITALREEVNAQLEVLTAKEAAAKAEAVEAAAKLDSVKDEIRGIEELKKSLLEQYTAATNAGDAEKAQALATDIASTETWLKEEASTAATVAEEAKMAATNAAAASEARESLATQINTAQTAGNSAATGILTIAKEKLALAAAKVNAVMEANKIAIVIGAFIALSYAIYKVITYETDLEKITKSANDAASAQESSMRKEISTLNELSKKLNGAKKGSTEWKDTKDQIVAQFGKYHSGLDAEIEKTGTLASSYNRLTESIRLSAAARAMDTYRKENDLSEDVDSYLESVRNSLTKGVLVKGADGKLKKTAIVGALRESIMQKTYDYIQNGDKSIFSDKEWELVNKTGAFYRDPSRGSSQSATDRLRSKVKLNQQGEEIIAQRYGTTIDKIDGRTPEVEVDSSKNLQEAYDKAAKDYKAATKKVAEMQKNRSAYTEKQWEDAQAELKSAKDAYEKAGGKTKTKKSSGSTPEQIESKQTASHQKLLDLQKQHAGERLKQQQEFEYQQWQNRIDLMDEGEAKVIAQMELDHKKEQTSLEEQKKQAIKEEIARQKAIFDAQEDENAVGNKKYAKQVFDTGNDNLAESAKQVDALNKLLASATERINELKQDPKANATSIKQLEGNMNEWTKKRDEFAKSLGDVDPSLINNILTRYDSLNGQLLAKQQRAINEHYKQQQEAFNQFLQEYGTYEQQAEAIIAEGEKRKQDIFAKFDMTDVQKKHVSEKIDADTNWKLFQKSGEYLKFFNSTLSLTKEEISKIGGLIKQKLDDNLKSGAMSAEDYYNELEKIDQILEKSENRLSNFESFMSGGLNGLFQNILDTRNSEYQSSLTNLQNATEKRKGLEEQIAKYTKQGDISSAMQAETDKLHAQFAEDAAASQAEGAASAMQGAQGAMSSMQVIDMIVHGINDMVQGIYDTFQQIQELADSLGTDTGADTDWGKAGAFLEAFSQASDGATKAWDSLKSGNPGGVISGVAQSLISWFTVFNKWHDAKLQRQIEKSKEIVQNIQYAYDALERRLQYGDSARTIAELFDVDKEKAKLEDIDNLIAEKQGKLAKLGGFGAKSTLIGQEIGNATGIPFGGAAGATIGAIIDLVNHSKKKRLEKEINELYAERERIAAQIAAYEQAGVMGLQRELLKQQRDELIKQREDEEAKKNTDDNEVKKINNDIDELSVKIREFAEQTAKDLYGLDLDQYSENLSDAVCDAFAEGEDAIESFDKAADDMLRSLVKKMINVAVFKPMIDKLRIYLFGEDGEGGVFGADGKLDANDIIGMKPYIEDLKNGIPVAQELWNTINDGLCGSLTNIDAIREKLTDISFDSVRDNFKSLLSDMESTTDDFANNFTDMLRNALIEGLMDSKYDTLLKEWYVAFAEAMDDQNLTDEERERLRQQYQAIVDQGIADRNAINDIVGGGAYSQQASKGEAWGMTQETGEELNGRFTALVELQAANNTLVGQGNSLAIGILATLQSIAATSNTVTGSGDNETLLSIRDMMFLSTGHLADIAKYTKSLQTMSDDMTKIKDAIEKI